MTAYISNDNCPVCGRTIKRRPADLAGRPCATCSTTYITPRDHYRLRNARLTLGAYLDIIKRAKDAHDAQDPEHHRH